MRTNALRLLAAPFALSLFAAACADDDPTAETVAEAGDEMSEMSDDEMSEMDAMSEMDDEANDHEGHDAGHEGHDTEGHDTEGHDTEGHDTEGHDHGEPVEFEGADVPTIDIAVEADPAGGINVTVATTNYTVAPDAASGEHVEGEGHFHLSVDGVKIQRFYNEAIYYAGVTEGEVTVMVELSANDHRAYAVGGEPIVAMTTFDVPPHDHGEHDHGDAAEVEWDGDAPELAIEVVEDPKSGYNAFITVEGMTLSAENVNGANVAGEGHLHIYVNGQKLGRLYGTATHIPVLPDGDVEITIGAFANDHSVYVLNGDPIEASTTIVVAS